MGMTSTTSPQHHAITAEWDSSNEHLGGGWWLMLRPQEHANLVSFRFMHSDDVSPTWNGLHADGSIHPDRGLRFTAYDGFFKHYLSQGGTPETWPAALAKALAILAPLTEKVMALPATPSYQPHGRRHGQ